MTVYQTPSPGYYLLMTNYTGFLLPTATQFASIALMVAVLLWRPQGLFGERIHEVGVRTRRGKREPIAQRAREPGLEEVTGGADFLEPPGGWIETRYGAKSRREGRRPYYLRYRKL